MKPRIGFLITHGTDTMAWGLSFLTYSLKNLSHPIAFVGSQRPMTAQFSSSDAYANIELAINIMLRMRKPLIFLVFNEGKKVFLHSIWKKDKWDTDAFTGKLLAEKKSNDFLAFYRFKENIHPLDKLYIIRTGGTIEASLDENNFTLNAGKRMDVVYTFIRKEFGYPNDKHLAIKNIEDIPLLAKDSSDLTPNDWILIAKRIEQLSRENGYRTYSDINFEKDIPILFASPIVESKHYFAITESAKAIVFVGYGAGNVNIMENSDFSPISLFEHLKEEGKLVVLSTHPEEGILDPVYENGAEIFRRGLALPSLDFSIARAQIKMGFITAHQEEILDFGEDKETADKLIKILFLSGAKFSSFESRKWFEETFGISIPKDDLLINRPFQEALYISKEYLHPEKKQRILFLTDVKNTGIKGHYASIVRIDEFSGENKMGVEINSALGLANLLVNSFEWSIGILDLWNDFDIYEYFHILKNSHIIFWESGKVHVSDHESFDSISSSVSGKELFKFYTSLFELSLNERAKNKEFPPSVYMGASYHLHVLGLISSLDHALEKDKYWLPKHVLTEWDEIVSTIKGRKPKTPVIENISITPGMATLKPYEPPIKNLLEDYINAYRNTSNLLSGAIEDLLPHDKIDIVLLHEDSVHEEWLLYLNWAFKEIFTFRRKYNLLNNPQLTGIPFGIEITSSLFKDGKSLRAASIATYYRTPDGYFYKDIALQFHPHLLYDYALYPPDDPNDLIIDFRNDGIKLLLYVILNVFENYKINC